MISARSTRHFPWKATTVGCDADQRLSAAVHSRARPRSNSAWQPSMTAQYTTPTAIGETRSTVTATMISSNNAAASVNCPRRAWTCANTNRLKTARSGSPYARAISTLWRAAFAAASTSPCLRDCRETSADSNPAAGQFGVDSSRCSPRDNQPPPRAHSPRLKRSSTSQNTQRAARSKSLACSHSICARSHNSALTSSPPARYVAMASRSRSTGRRDSIRADTLCSARGGNITLRYIRVA